MSMSDRRNAPSNVYDLLDTLAKDGGSYEGWETDDVITSEAAKEAERRHLVVRRLDGGFGFRERLELTAAGRRRIGLPPKPTIADHLTAYAKAFVTQARIRRRHRNVSTDRLG